MILKFLSVIKDKKKMEKKIKDIVIRMDLYPRMDVDNKKIQEYSENTENLPPILINQDNILIDGLHRLRAHKQVELKDIEVVIETTKSENELYLRAIETNATHGLQLSMKDKKSVAVKLYDLKNRERLVKSLSISSRTFDGWVSNKSKQLKEQKEEEAISTYLHAELTQKKVAEMIGVSEAEISRIFQNCKFAEMEDFKPFLYNIWNSSKDNSITHFGNIPQAFVENLLYYYTEPFDIVYDPFAGGGITIDACKKWMRRYYVADRKPSPAREEEIKKQDINDGISKDLPNNIKLVFLDPPYWKQAENQYSKDKKDLANMSLESFYKSLEYFIKDIKKKLAKNGKIALIIQATQWKNNNVRIDHAFDLMKMMDKIGFEVEQRIICPYSTEQYNAQMVEKAKKDKICLQTYRDLIIWKKS